MNFTFIGCFRSTSLVTYLFLYSNVEKFMHLGLNIMDALKHKQLVFLWTGIVRIDPRNEGPSYFASDFLYIVYSIINNSPAPSLHPKSQSFLQVSKYIKVGD